MTPRTDGVYRVALTGGIATGKSYVRGRLQDADIPTIDADVLAREVVAPGTDGLRAIVARFGHDLLTEAGALDRARLGTIVFADPQARQDLEALVHPAVYGRLEAWFTGLARNGYTGPAVADIPLLFETGRAAAFDCVVVVACDASRQLARLQARDGVDEADARRRMASQWPIEAKPPLADVVIRTDGSFAETDAQVEALVRHLWEAAAIHQH
jgi:dephospho-CoA kinase